MCEFRWNTWNVEHIAEHGVESRHAEFVVNHPERGFPRREGKHKFRVWGQDMNGRYVQVIYIFDPPEVVYVIHARPLTDAEKRHLRKRRE